MLTNLRRRARAFGIGTTLVVLNLSGEGLSIRSLAGCAGTDDRVVLSRSGMHRMRAARAVVEVALQKSEPVYGLTTGLGARVAERLSAEDLTAFSYQTVRGRAHAIGPPLAPEIVRAAMIVRLNTLLKGASGATPATALFLRDCLNRGLTSVIGETASIGAGDLCWGATMALTFIGEGKMTDRLGTTGPAADILSQAGLKPLVLGPRDGLALANHSSFTAAIGALSVWRAHELLAAAQAAGALSLEGFGANLSVLDPSLLDLRPQPGQAEAASEILRLLKGSRLMNAGAARRLQDPLSLRNIAQVHGSAVAAMAFSREAVEAEINGASDNPAVDVESGIARSTGAYHTPHLTVALETLTRSLSHLAALQLARISKMLSHRFTDLPLFLASPGANSNGFAPVMKIAEALFAEIQHAALPVQVWPSVNADGTEDGLTNAPLAAKNAVAVVDKLRKLTAIELMVATQAIELSGLGGNVAPRLKAMMSVVRDVSASLVEDRPLGADIEAVADCVGSNALNQALR